MTGPCLCGDPNCPSCGSSMGTYGLVECTECDGENINCPLCHGTGRIDVVNGSLEETLLCDVCGKPSDSYVCDACLPDVKKAIRET